MAILARHTCAFFVGLSTLAWAPDATAQEIRIRGPIKACIAILIHDATPADLEWSYWVAASGGTSTNGRVNSFGVGSEATAGTTIGTHRRYGGAFELRSGPWLNMVTDTQGIRSEGGFVFSVGQTSHAQWGTYALRIGGGFGEDSLGRTPHVVATLTGGVRYVRGRYSERGACDPKPRPAPSLLAENVRLFATLRAGLSSTMPWQMTFGIEFTPSFFLPPYSLGKWIGARF